MRATALGVGRGPGSEGSEAIEHANVLTQAQGAGLSVLLWMGWGQTRSDWIRLDVIRGARGSQSRLIYSNALLYSLLQRHTSAGWRRWTCPACARLPFRAHRVGSRVKGAGKWAADGGRGEGGQEDQNYVRLPSFKRIDVGLGLLFEGRGGGAKANPYLLGLTVELLRVTDAWPRAAHATLDQMAALMVRIDVKHLCVARWHSQGRRFGT